MTGLGIAKEKLFYYFPNEKFEEISHLGEKDFPVIKPDTEFAWQILPNLKIFQFYSIESIESKT